jgi:hypothetical protein
MMKLDQHVIDAVLERLKPTIDAIIRDKVADVAKRLDAISKENERLIEENADLRQMLATKVMRLNPFEDRDATLN